MISFGEDISHSRTEDCNQYNVNNLGTEFLFTNLVPRAFSLPWNEVVCSLITRASVGFFLNSGTSLVAD